MRLVALHAYVGRSPLTQIETTVTESDVPRLPRLRLGGGLTDPCATKGDEPDGETDGLIHCVGDPNGLTDSF